MQTSSVWFRFSIASGPGENRATSLDVGLLGRVVSRLFNQPELCQKPDHQEGLNSRALIAGNVDAFARQPLLTRGLLTRDTIRS
jgi:hypothetical protein